MFGIRSGHVHVVKYLAMAGADLNIADVVRICISHQIHTKKLLICFNVYLLSE